VKRLSDPLRDSTMDLAFGDLWVQTPPDIVDAGEALDIDAAGFRVDFDLANIGAVRDGQNVALETLLPDARGTACCLQLAGELKQSNTPVGAHDHEAPALKNYVRHAGLEPIGSGLACGIEHRCGGAQDRDSTDLNG
jgi:hypothetical protein